MEGAGFAADWLVGFPVQSDWRWFPSSNSTCIHSHGYVHALTKTQIKPKGWQRGQGEREVVKKDLNMNHSQRKIDGVCNYHVLLPGHCSLLLLSGPNPLLEVIQFVTRFQLQPQLTLILRRIHDVAKEERDIEAPWFHQVH